jgi:hypothetical protein
MIIKVQLSLNTTATRRQAMFYNQDRSYMVQRDATPELLKFMGDRVKAYVVGMFINDELHVSSEVPDQDW